MDATPGQYLWGEPAADPRRACDVDQDRNVVRPADRPQPERPVCSIR
jgi:hypothetical protein